MNHTPAARISAAQLTIITGLSDRRHRQLAAEGHFPAPQASSYELEPTVRGLLNYYRKAAERSKSAATEELTRLRKAQADGQEAKNARERGASIDVEDALELVYRFTTVIRQRIITSSMSEEEKRTTLLNIQRMKDIDFTEVKLDEDDEAELAGKLEKIREKTA